MNHRMKTNSIIKKSIRFLFALIIFLIVVLPFFLNFGEEPSDMQWASLDGEWQVKYNDEVYEDVRLSELKLPLVLRGDTVQMSCTIPNDIDIAGAEIAANYINCAIEIFLDDRLIYSYGIDRYNENLFLGSGIHGTLLPDDYQGKELRISIYVGEDHAFSTLSTPLVGTSADITRHMLSENQTQLAISLFLIVFGLMLGVITLVMMVTQGWFFRLFAIALFSILVGCWTMCGTNLMQWFVDSILTMGWFEYMCIYVLPLPFMAYYYETFMDKENPRAVRILYCMMMTLHTILVGVVLALQLSNTLHFPRLLPVVHTLMAVDIMLVTAMVIRNAVKKPMQNRMQNRMYLIITGVVLLFVVYELLHYNFNKYVSGMPDGSYKSTICYGALMVVFALMVDCCGDIKNIFFRQAQESAFEQMAYTDELTGLRNRRYFDREIEKLVNDGASFGVVSMDMNHLKYMNDTYGHDMGDEALIQFSRILEQVFSDGDIPCRIGGDEFNVLIVDADSFSFEEKQELLTKKLSQWNAKSQRIQLTTAVGYAARYEVDEEADEWEICRLADTRMYECKRTQKQIDFRVK